MRARARHRSFSTSWRSQIQRSSGLDGASKRIGRVRVDEGDLDHATLDRFLAATRIYPSYSHEDRDLVEPFLAAFRAAGFHVLDGVEIGPGARPVDEMTRGIQQAAEDGWVTLFMSPTTQASPWVHLEMRTAMTLGARLVPVLLPGAEVPTELAATNYVDVQGSLGAAAARVTRELLRRQF